MSSVDEAKKRIAAIMEDEPWMRSPSAIKKTERYFDAQARKARRESKKPPDRPYEWDEQKWVCQWLKRNEVSFFAPAAEIAGKDGDENRINAFKAIGFKPGVPDLIIVDLAADGRPVVLEMKRTRLTESSLTPAQRVWRKIFPKKGWHHLIGYGHEDAIAKLKAVGIGKGVD